MPHAKFSVTLAVAFRRGRLDALEAGDGADRLLDRPRDQLFDLERTDAGVADADSDGRARDSGIRSTGSRDSEIAAEQHDDRTDHEHRDRTLNRETRNAHRPLPWGCVPPVGAC